MPNAAWSVFTHHHSTPPTPPPLPTSSGEKGRLWHFKNIQASGSLTLQHRSGGGGGWWWGGEEDGLLRRSWKGFHGQVTVYFNLAEIVLIFSRETLEGLEESQGKPEQKAKLHFKVWPLSCCSNLEPAFSFHPTRTFAALCSLSVLAESPRSQPLLKVCQNQGRTCGWAHHVRVGGCT